MTLKELIAKNEATRKKREAERLAKEAEAEKEEKEEPKPKPKKGKKPANRMYLVKEEVPQEEEQESLEEETKSKVIDY